MSLLFSLLDEYLFLFHAEGLVVKKATVGAVDRDAWKLTAKGCVDLLHDLIGFFTSSLYLVFFV